MEGLGDFTLSFTASADEGYNPESSSPSMAHFGRLETLTDDPDKTISEINFQQHVHTRHGLEGACLGLWNEDGLALYQPSFCLARPRI